MRKKVQFFVSLFLALALLVSFAACGGKTVPGGPDATDPANPAEDETEEVSTHPGALGIDVGMDDYVLSYDYADSEGSPRKLLLGYGMDTAGEDDPVAEIGFNIYDMEHGVDYNFILRSVVGRNYATGAGYKARAWLYACYNKMFLFSVSAYPGDAECYYFYNGETEELQTVGLMTLMRYLGNFLLMQPEADENGLAPLYYYDWLGDLIYTAENVAEITRSENDLYLLSGAPAELWRVDEDEFYSRTPDFTGEKVAGLGDYSATFGVYDPEVISFTRNDGGHFFTCPVKDAAARLAALEQTPAEAQEPAAEACGYFEVTLPGFWQGHYGCEKTETDLTFYHVPETGEKNMLFSLTYVPTGEAANYVSAGVYLKKYTEQGGGGFLVASSNRAYQDVETEEELYLAMLNSMDTVAASVKPVREGAAFEDFNYASLQAEFKARSAAGTDFRLSVNKVDRNVLVGELRGVTAGGEKNSADVYIIMFNEVGYLVWSSGPETRGDGVVQLKESGLTLEIGGTEEAAWVETGGELPFTKSGS